MEKYTKTTIILSTPGPGAIVVDEDYDTVRDIVTNYDHGLFHQDGRRIGIRCSLIATRAEITDEEAEDIKASQR